MHEVISFKEGDTRHMNKHKMVIPWLFALMKAFLY